MSAGKLFYIVGASDVGRDHLFAYARAHLDDSHPVMFAHLYTTRPTAANGVNHVALSEAEFDLRRRLGLFVMDWEISGLRYGIGTEINYWLAMGLPVVVNGSHLHLEQAFKAYPDMTVVWVSDEPEHAAAQTARPARPLYSTPASGYRMVHISNGGPAALAGEKLVSVLVGERN